MRSLSLWGDSLAAVNSELPNSKSRPEAAPLDADNPNRFGEPSGGLLVMLAALFEDDIQAVYASGALASFQSLLSSQFLYVPHDAVVPGVLTIGDVADTAAALAPRPLRFRECWAFSRRHYSRSVSLLLKAIWVAIWRCGWAWR